MSKILLALNAAKALLSQVKLSQEPLQNGSIIQYDGDDIAKGATIYLQDGNSDFSVLPDGLYQTKSGKKFTITDGVCTEVDDSTETPPTETPDPKKQAQAKQKKEEDMEEDMSEDAKNDDGTPKYGDVKYADPGYQADKKKRYPIDTIEHIKEAWNYIAKKKNGEQYSDADLTKVKDAIEAAWKDKIDPKGPPSAQKDEKDSKEKEEAKKVKAAKVKAKKTKAIALKKEVLASGKKLKADSADLIAPPGAGANLPDDTTDGDDEFDDYDEETPGATTAVVVNISDVIGAALQPVYQQIYDLQSIVSALKDIITSQKAQNIATQTSLSKVIDQVAVIANLPAGSAIEKEDKPFVKMEKTTSRAMKIMGAGADTK